MKHLLQFLTLFILPVLFSTNSNLVAGTRILSVPGEKLKVAGLAISRGVGIKAFDQSTGWDTVLIRTSNSNIDKAVSPSGFKVAVAYRLSDTLKVAIINLHPFKVNVIGVTQNIPLISMKWKDDANLGFNYIVQKKDGDKFVFQNAGAYSFNTDSMKLGILKFNNGASIFEWLPSGHLVTKFAKDYYVIDLKTSKTIATVANVDKLAFSKDGKKCLYYQDVEVTDENGRKSKIPELYMADYTGKNAKTVSSYMNQPRHAQWSPTNATIAFDIQSKEWSNIRHLAYYIVQSGKTLVNNNIDYSRAEPLYSASGMMLFFSEREITVVNGRTTLNAVVEDQQNGTKSTLHSGTLGDPNDVVGAAAVWFEGSLLKLEDNEGFKIYDTETLEVSKISDQPIYLWRSR